MSVAAIMFGRAGSKGLPGKNVLRLVGRPCCYYPLLDVGEMLAQYLVKAVEGAGIETLQTVERTTFIERPHRTIGETM